MTTSGGSRLRVVSLSALYVAGFAAVVRLDRYREGLTVSRLAGATIRGSFGLLLSASP